MIVSVATKMEWWCESKHKSWLYWLLVLMLIPVLMVQQIQGGCIEEERKALLEIKASLIDTYDFNVDSHLPTWVDDGRSGGECCDWERVKCNKTTGHVTYLSLRNMLGKVEGLEVLYLKSLERIWPLNISLFLHFKELTSLNLSLNCLDSGIVSTGLEKLSSLKKLEILDLSRNQIDKDIFPSLGALTSLRVLHLGDNFFGGYFPALALENLETLDLNNKNGHFHLSRTRMQGFEQVSMLRKLKILNLGDNDFNNSFITSLSELPLLEALDLGLNKLRGSFPAQELAHLTNLKKLDLSFNLLEDTPSIQDCKRLSRLKKLESIALGFNEFNKSIISCLSFLSSLKTLDLSMNFHFGSSIPIQELSSLRELETLDLSSSDFDSVTLNDCKRLSRMKKLESIDLNGNDFNNFSILTCLSVLPSLKTLDLSYSLRSLNDSFSIQALTSFHHLEVLDLSNNELVGSIPSTIQALSSLRAVSFANNRLNGSLPDHGLCELKNLHELDLSQNMLDGNLPPCLNNLSSLKLFDISSNRFTGKILPQLIANLRSLEYIDFSNNKFEGSFSFSSFSNHSELEAVRFTCDDDKFEVETEEPIGWIPMFQLKFLVISSCNLNRPKGSVVPSFLHHQDKLSVLDLSHNSLGGQFPNWLIRNNPMLEALHLRNNSFYGNISMLQYRNVNTWWWDISGNHLTGTIPGDALKFLPFISHLNLSRNNFNGVIPSSLGDSSKLQVLDLSNNEFFGEVPKGLLTNQHELSLLKLSNNRLHGEILSGDLGFYSIQRLYLDSNYFTGKIGNGTGNNLDMTVLDISSNSFRGMIPSWISNMSSLRELVVRNNSFEGRFPCGTSSFLFLDISQNFFSGPLPSCLNFQSVMHLHLGSNRFTGLIPNVFCNLTSALSLDIGNNNLSGRIPEFLGELSTLRILILRNNNFRGYIPNQLCQLSNVSLIDLSSNSLFGSIPHCLQNINSPIYHAFIQTTSSSNAGFEPYKYKSVFYKIPAYYFDWEMNDRQDEVMFTTKTLSLSYKGNNLDLMTGLDLSCNKLTGEIPEELGSLTQIHALNLSHNQLVGLIPVNFSYLANIESLDLSSNRLSGRVPSQLIKLTSLEFFNVSHNNLSGSLPEMKGQFSTFTKESYEGNPLLCGPPLEKKCTTISQVTAPPTKEDIDKWYDMDMACFYGSSSSTWVVFLLGFVAVLYTNPYWRRRWLDFVEDCMYRCCYFLDDSVRKLSMFFRK